MGDTGENGHNWKGGRTRTSHGYILIYKPEHPRALHGKYIYEHVAIAEKAIGRFLPEKVEVHHVNSIEDDNRNTNLVICENRAFHKLLHKRMRAFKSCGHASWLSCAYCKKYGPSESMYLTPNGNQHWHRECQKTNGIMNKEKRAQHCWKEAVLEVEGTKPVWVVPAKTTPVTI